eukprot:COSAG02_NODE_4658_length_5125_cov_4.436331_3_plen_195_part_00
MHTCRHVVLHQRPTALHLSTPNSYVLMATARERTIICPSARNRFLLQCAMRLCDAAVSAACSHSTSCFHLSTQVAVASSMRSVVAASTLEVAIPRWRSRYAPGLAARLIPGWFHRARESIFPLHPGHPARRTEPKCALSVARPNGTGGRPVRSGGEWPAVRRPTVRRTGAVVAPNCTRIHSVYTVNTMNRSIIV